MSDSSSDKKIPCETWSRVVGYLRPTSHWNAAKKHEFKARRVYDVKEYRETPQNKEDVASIDSPA